MVKEPKRLLHDFKGLGFSKIGYFKEVRSKIKELERLNRKKTAKLSSDKIV